MNRIGLLKRALRETPDADPQLLVDLRALEDSVRAVQVARNGDQTARRRNERTPSSLRTRLGRFTGGAWSGSLNVNDVATALTASPSCCKVSRACWSALSVAPSSKPCLCSFSTSSSMPSYQ